MKRPYAVSLGTDGPVTYTPPCAACGRRLKLTTASMALLKRRNLPVLCIYGGDDRRVTRPMTRQERAIMLMD